MKYNIEVARDIMLYIEKNLDYEDKDAPVPKEHKTLTHETILTDPYFAQCDREELSYAFEILCDGGYIKTSQPTIYDQKHNFKTVFVLGLTSEGHDLLDNIKNDDIWYSICREANKLGGVSLKVIAEKAERIAQNRLNNSTSYIK